MTAATPTPVGDQQEPALIVVARFVNTHDVEAGSDVFSATDVGRRWLTRHGLLGADDRLRGEADLVRLRQLREALRACLEANREEAPLPAHALRVLDDEASRCPVRLVLSDPADVGIAAAGVGLERAIGHILGHVYDGMRDGTWERLKVCLADDCQWAFYDESRNRSGKWCSSGCSNRANVRAYRRRKRGQDDQ